MRGVKNIFFGNLQQLAFIGSKTTNYDSPFGHMLNKSGKNNSQTHFEGKSGAAPGQWFFSPIGDVRFVFRTIGQANLLPLVDCILTGLRRPVTIPPNSQKKGE